MRYGKRYRKPRGLASRAAKAIILLPLILFLLVLPVVFWGSHGSIIDVLKGSFPSPIVIADGSISEKGGRVDYPVTVAIDRSTVIQELPAEFLSFGIDIAQVTGGSWWNPEAAKREFGSGTVKSPPFDFTRPGLAVLTKALSPAFLRIGGSEADRTYYDMDEHPVQTPPAGYATVLTKKMWDDVNAFAAMTGCSVVFTANAGPGPRVKGSWKPDNLADLADYTARSSYPVAVWEFGNELNGFAFLHGPVNAVSPTAYRKELGVFRDAIRQKMPESAIAFQGSSFWPVLGEGFIPFRGFWPAALKGEPNTLDLLTWHYYPQQSRRSPVATRRASPTRLLDPKALDEAGYWAKEIIDWRDTHAPGTPIWLGETGNAQAGGEPGVSDTWLGSLWWMDELGLMAREGMRVVIRHTLVGSDYGLLDEKTLEPRPDYWCSLLWKRLMGPLVHRVTVEGTGSSRLRAYAHERRTGNGRSITALLINLDPSRNALVSFPGMPDHATAYRLTVPDVFGKKMIVNGAALGTDWSFTPKKEMDATVPVRVHPLSITFVTWTID